MVTKEQLLKTLTQTSDNNTTSYSKNDVYPHWNTPVGKTCKLRLIPDKNESNTVFCVDKSTRTLPFNGIKGKTDKKVYVNVPAFNTTPSEQLYVPIEYKFSNKEDVIQMAMNGWFETRPEEYKTYKRKIQHIYQGFVRVDNSGEKPEDKPDSILRKFYLADSIHKFVLNKDVLITLPNLPIDYEKGRDLNISVTQTKYKEYTANWDFVETSLNEEEATVLVNNQHHDLSTFLLKPPTDAEKNAMLEMFEASHKGLPYDMDRWGQYYKPYGNFDDNEIDKTSTASSAPSTPVKPNVNTIVNKVAEASKPVVETKVEAPVTPTMQGTSSDELLAKIRNLQKKSAS